VTRSDADALWAHLQSLPAVHQANRPHELRFPYDSQVAMAVWRALSFRPQVQRADPAHSAEWNRGAYLVEGLGHCATCHASRNALGATRDAAALGGGPIPMQGWYAPSLAAREEAGVADWDFADVVALLQTGRSPQGAGAVLGPMAEVVTRSTQHLHADDLRAMAEYLKSLPQQATVPTQAQTPVEAAAPAVLQRGQAVYADRCAGCHGKQGEGARPAYPALAGNRAVTLSTPTNLIRVVLGGGFPPDTVGQPRPYGMPPFGQDLSDEDIAAVLTHIRQSWGQQAPAVPPLAVQRLR
jgi:mono/diheme cytochrome c family protein